MSLKFRAYAPASAANLSVGFDLLGAALKPVDGSVYGDEIFIEKTSEDCVCKLSMEGRFASKLPQDPNDNIVFKAFELYKSEAVKAGFAACGVNMVLRKNLPVCSGLGSSASSAVAAIVALDVVNGCKFKDADLIRMMGILEGGVSGSIHYDNVAPCFFGGLQLLIGENGIISKTFKDFDNWYWVSCFPGIKVSTSKARSILPKEYARCDCITYARRLAAFVDACHRNDAVTASSCLKDVIAEPYREQLIPGLQQARAFGESHGALATGISGSGSSLFSVYDDLQKALEMKAYLEQNFIANEDGFCHICKVDRRGAYAERWEK